MASVFCGRRELCQADRCSGGIKIKQFTVKTRNVNIIYMILVILELWDKKRDKTCENLQLHMHRGREEALGEANPSDPTDMGCAPEGCSGCQPCTSAAPHLVSVSVWAVLKQPWENPTQVTNSTQHLLAALGFLTQHLPSQQAGDVFSCLMKWQWITILS